MRYERKYRIEQLSPAAVRQTVRLLPHGFRVAYEERVVNNIYFDTPDFIKIRENRDGISNRKKLRVRWYGDLRGEEATLEIKGKKNMLGTKDFFKTKFSDFKNLKELTDFVLTATNSRNYELRPVILNQYKRTYFVTSDQKIRITVDENLRFFPLFDKGSVTPVSTIFDADESFWMNSPYAILELKYERGNEQYANEIAQYLPFRLTKFSKFATGMQHLVNKVV